MRIVIRRKKKNKALKRRKRKSFFRKVKIFLAVVLIFFVSTAFFSAKYVMGVLNNINTVQFDNSSEALGIYPSVEEYYKDSKVINIALLGVDDRNWEGGSRSDTIIIASFNKETGDIKLTSLMRDTYIKMSEDEGFGKLNSAFSYGGVELLIKDVNQNFDMNIKDYMIVNFASMGKIVDSVGGIELSITDEELPLINQCIDEQNTLSEEYQTQHLTQAGVQTLNGGQALGYCRIRNLGNSDFDRVARQKIVLTAIYTKVKTEYSYLGLIKLAKAVLPEITTSMKGKDLIPLFRTYLKSTSAPVTGMLTGDDILKAGYMNGTFYLFPKDLEDVTKALHEIIYDNANYSPSKEVKNISKKIKENIKDIKLETIYTGSTIE